jgi:HD-GYP domain-containing protein (c-di-GMP phosphodiesterase class II)
MTSARSYRTPLSAEQALAELALCSGSQFDPALAEPFVDVWSRSGAWPAAVAS